MPSLVYTSCQVIGSFFVGLNLCLSAGLSALAQTAPVCLAELTPQIEAITNRPALRRAHWGILVQTVEIEPQTLYAHNAEKFFVPASNVKLLTTAAALTQLGPTFRIQTTVYQIPAADRSVMLQVVGRGDPSLTDAQLKTLAQQLREQGIQQVQTLIVDDQYFQGDRVNPTWEWEDLQAGYGTTVNSLILNQNAVGLRLIPQAVGQALAVEWDDPAVAPLWQVLNQSTTVATTAPEFVQVGRDLVQPVLYVRGQLRVGSKPEPVAVSLPDPTRHFLERFQQILMDYQIQVEQTRMSSDPLPVAAYPLAVVTSPSLAELLVETNQQSNNLYAEVLLRLLAGERSPSQTTSSLEAGLNVLQQLLTDLGVDPDGYHLVDGSGLSRHNLISPIALVEILQAMARSPYTDTYRASLATAGISGTLGARFQDTAVRGQFQGKTGSLDGITALSGYLVRAGASQLAVSILVNYAEQTGEAQAAIDSIVELLAQLGEC